MILSRKGEAMLIQLNKYVDSGAESKVIAVKQLDTSQLDNLYLVARGGPYKLRSDPPMVVTMTQSRVNGEVTGSLTVKAVVEFKGHPQVDWVELVYKLFTSVRLYQDGEFVAAACMKRRLIGFEDSLRLNFIVGWGPELEASDLEWPSGADRLLTDEQIAELMDERSGGSDCGQDL